MIQRARWPHSPPIDVVWMLNTPEPSLQSSSEGRSNGWGSAFYRTCVGEHEVPTGCLESRGSFKSKPPLLSHGHLFSGTGEEQVWASHSTSRAVPME